jgi:hypothetical protein
MNAYTALPQQVAERMHKMLNWIQYGCVDPGPYDLPAALQEQLERVEHLATAAYDFQCMKDGITSPPTQRVPDWACGCGETLRGNEPSCWRCGGKKR